MPERNADLYPEHRSAGEVTVAVDTVHDGARAQRYFGTDLISRDILPVIIVVSNHGGSGVDVDPADVVKTRGSAMIDPLPPEIVIDDELLGGRLSEETRQQARTHLGELVFQAREVAPGETYRGVLFYPIQRQSRLDSGGFRVRDFAFGGLLSMQVVVTAVADGQRHRLGPFHLRHPTAMR
ncbi:hypothetical protein [Aquisalimonas sp.]|uniref:hypothetical protein n=1 Tax=Aquisalimonas sp. TaxID=1872621 RepID=UPI0025B8F594|nr:hypothetical protein [Aquisalimonas sp.]